MIFKYILFVIAYNDRLNIVILVYNYFKDFIILLAYLGLLFVLNNFIYFLQFFFIDYYLLFIFIHLIDEVIIVNTVMLIIIIITIPFIIPAIAITTKIITITTIIIHYLSQLYLLYLFHGK